MIRTKNELKTSKGDRQVELDIAKFIAIFFMILSHCLMVTKGFNNSVSHATDMIIGHLLGCPFSAPVFMFCMGVGMIYTVKHQITYGISYVGNVNFGENINPYVTSVTACAGSYSYPLWIMACEYNGVIRMKLIQSFDNDMLVKNIYQGFSELIPGTSFTDLGYHEFDEFHLKDVPRKR